MLVRVLNHDWGLALRMHKLEKFIRKNDDGDFDDGMEHNEVSDVYQVLAARMELVLAAFDYYASIGEQARSYGTSLHVKARQGTS